MLRSSRLARMSPTKHTVYLSYKGVYGPAILSGNSLIQAHASWLSKKQSCTKLLLTVRMRPAPIALNYSVEKSQFDSLVS